MNVYVNQLAVALFDFIPFRTIHIVNPYIYHDQSQTSRSPKYHLPVLKVHLLFEGFDRLLRFAGSGGAQQLPILPGDFAWGADARHEALHWEITLCTGEVGPSLRAVLPVQ